MTGYRHHGVVRIVPSERQSGDGSDAQVLRARSRDAEEIAVHFRGRRVLQRAEV